MPENVADPDDQDNERQPNGEPLRKKARAGRPRNQDDFWYQAEQWLNNLVTKWGKDISASQWKP